MVNATARPLYPRERPGTHCVTEHDTAGEPFLGRVPKLSVNLKEILSRALGYFEEQNKVLDLSIIITNYCIIIINAHYNYIINA